MATVVVRFVTCPDSSRVLWCQHTEIPYAAGKDDIPPDHFRF